MSDVNPIAVPTEMNTVPTYDQARGHVYRALYEDEGAYINSYKPELTATLPDWKDCTINESE